MSKSSNGLGKAVKKAAERLPKGWTIAIVVEKDETWVELGDPDNYGYDIDTPGMSLEGAVRLAVETAQGRSHLYFDVA